MSGEPLPVYVDASIVLEALLGGTKAGPPPIERGVWVGSELLEVELFRTVDGMRLSGALDDLETARLHRALTVTLARFHLFPVSDDVTRKARSPFPIPVRALHALHAATAQVVQEEAGPLEFWTRDAGQASAAVTLGLAVRGVGERARH